jgi:hypothetical protein
VCALYEETRAKVKTPDGLTQEFVTEAGVLQGDVLAPFLFVMCLDVALRIALPDDSDGFELERRRSSRYPAKKLSMMAFADDIVLISSCVTGAQKMLTSLENACLQVGLIINSDKTKAISLNSKGGPAFHTHHGIIEQCQSFIYLGALIPDSTDDITRRKGLAWAALGRLKSIWTSSMTRIAKAKLFMMTVEPVLMYGAETWTLSPTMEHKVDGIFMRLLRAALNVPYQAKLTNKALCKEVGVNTPSIALRRKRRQLVTNVQNGNHQHLPQLCNTVLWCPGRFSGSSHSTASFLGMVEHDATVERMSLEEWIGR